MQIHGRGLSTNNLINLNVASGIEATRATRLYELWYQQVLFGGKADGGEGATGLPGTYRLGAWYNSYKGAFGRENDTMGLGVGWARIAF